eukprot:gene20721-22755_t
MLIYVTATKKLDLDEVDFPPAFSVGMLTAKRAPPATQHFKNYDDYISLIDDDEEEEDPIFLATREAIHAEIQQLKEGMNLVGGFRDLVFGNSELFDTVLGNNVKPLSFATFNFKKEYMIMFFEEVDVKVSSMAAMSNSTSISSSQVKDSAFQHFDDLGNTSCSLLLHVVIVGTRHHVASGNSCVLLKVCYGDGGFDVMDEEDKGLDAAKEKIINRRKSRFEQQEGNKRWKDNLLESSSGQQYTNSTVAFNSNLPVRSKRKLKKKRLSVAVDDSYSSNAEGVIPELPDTPNHSPMQDDDNVYIEIDSVLNYVYELSPNNGISPANDEYSVFSLSDVDAKEGKLKERSFVFVIRKSVEFEDCWGWVYACSCTKEQVRFCNSIARRVPLKRKEFDNEYNKSCLHIKAASHLMAEFDSRNRIEPESHYINTTAEHFRFLDEPGSDSPVFLILSTENVVSVWDQQKNDYGAFTIIRNHLSCLCCPSSTSCSHIDILTSMEGSTKLPSNAERILQCVKEEGSTSGAENQKTLSWQQIPFQPQSMNKERQFVSTLGDDDSFVLKPLLVPDLKCPNCGGKWSSDDPVKNDWVYSKAVAVFLAFCMEGKKLASVK